MEDFSLEDLQAQFRAVQKKEATHRLSERNCAELILKLKDLGLVDLLFTLNGREFLTRKQLEREIKDKVLEHRGRINYLDLQPLLNVDLSYIESRVQDMVRKDRQYRIVGGEIITGYYLAGVAEEIEGSLQEQSELWISDLATRFGLSSDFIIDLIEQHIGSVIHGTLEGSSLYTEAFVAKQRSGIRGAFRALTRPIPIADVRAALGFHTTLFVGLVEGLVSSRELPGSLQGKGMQAVYTPNVYSEARQKYVDSFFLQNKYIDFNTMDRLQFPRPKAYLEGKYKEGLALPQCYIDRSIINQLDATAADAINSESWIDALPIVPAIIDTASLCAMFRSCPSLKQEGRNTNCIILNDQYVVSQGFLARCLKLYEASITDKLAKGLIEKLTPTAPESSSKEEADEDDSRGKKGKGRRATKAKPKEEPKSSNTKGKKGSKESPEDKMIQENLEDFKKWFDEAPEDFLEALILHLRGAMARIREEASRAVFVGNDQSKAKQSSQDDLNTLYQNILLFQKGIESIGEEEQVLEKHLLKTLCSEVVNRILVNQAVHHCLPASKAETTEERNAIISQLPSQEKACISKLVKSAAGKYLKEFMADLDPVAEKCQIRLKGLDKKTERQLIQTHRATLMDQLTKETNPAAALHLVAVLLYLKKNAAVIHAPGRSVSVLISKVKEQLPAEQSSLLVEFQGLVVKYLTTSQNGADPQMEKLLEEKLPALKETVLGKVEAK